jgi:Bacterial archaeo-eukaryotic release factor family 3
VDLLSGQELEQLIGKPGGPCVSIFLPTHRAGAETRQDPIRLKNLIGEARDLLLAKGLRAAEADVILAPARDLLGDGVFWRHQGDGLAVFLSRETFHHYRLPLRFEELMVVADRYHVKPMLPLLTGDGRFYVLALSLNGVRLLRATRRGTGEVELPGVPGNLADALRHRDPEKQLQFHTGTSGRGDGGRPAVFHGHASEEDPKEHALRYFRQVDRGVAELLKGQRSPLLLAGVGYLLPIYREANTYPYLEEEGLTGNPEGLSDEELHERAWEIVQSRFSKTRREATTHYEQLAGTGRTSTDLGEIVPAAYFGRVDILFVALDSRQWGTFDPGTAEVSLHEEAASGDGDLLDCAAVQTLLNGGNVYALDHEEMPDGAIMASVLRY